MFSSSKSLLLEEMGDSFYKDIQCRFQMISNVMSEKVEQLNLLTISVYQKIRADFKPDNFAFFKEKGVFQARISLERGVF